MAARSNTAVESTDRALVVTRVFDAPRELMWKTLTDARAPGTLVGAERLDLASPPTRAAPRWHLSIQPEHADGSEMWGKWVYREIVAPERLVFVSSFTDEKGNLTRNPFEPNWPLEILGHLDVHRGSRPHDGDGADGPDKRDRSRRSRPSSRGPSSWKGDLPAPGTSSTNTWQRSEDRIINWLKEKNDATESISELQR